MYWKVDQNNSEAVSEYGAEESAVHLAQFLHNFIDV